jgi:HEAT repeat protein
MTALIGALANLKLGEEASEEAENAMKHLAAFGDDAVSGLVTNLRWNSSPEVRGVMARVLAMIGSEKSVSSLLDCISREQNAGIKADLARSLQALDNPTCGPAILQSLCVLPDDDPAFQAIREAIPRDGSPWFVNLLVERYHDDHVLEWQKANILAALSDIRNEEAVVSLQSILSSEADAKIKEQAALTLGQIGSFEASTELVLMLELKTDVGVRSLVCDGIANIRNKESLGLLKSAAAITGDEALRTAIVQATVNILGEEPDYID